MSAYIKSLSKPIVIVGLGKSGEAAKRLLLLSGASSQNLFTFDLKAPADFNDGFAMLNSLKPGTLVVSPGVALSTDWIQFAKNQGTTITSEINLAVSVLTTEKVIGITGSLGKSTTVATLGHAATYEDPNAFVGGNLGTPFATYAADVLEGRSRAKWVILELSSYQLENCDQLQCEFSAITYLTPNHMERYQSLEEYYKTKWSLFGRTRKMGFMNEGGGDLIGWAQGQSAKIELKTTNPDIKDLKKYNFADAKLIGSHNQENIALAASIAEAAGWKFESVLRLKDFAGLEHRMENLGFINDVRIINDSKATAIDSVKTAVQSALENCNGTLWLLLGGRDKNLPWEDLAFLKNNEKIRPLFFGEAKQIITNKTGILAPTFDRLFEATKYAQENATSGDTILLSPGGTSLDEFKSFEDRGNHFKQWFKRST